MRLRDETPLTPEAQAEIAALEAALRGEPVAPEHAGIADLALALRDERPRPDAGFAAALDERAGAGFPRERRSSLGARAAAWRASLGASPRRWVPVVGVAASVLVATALALSLTGADRGPGTGDGSLLGSAQQATTVAPSDAGSTTGSSAAGGASAPRAPEALTGATAPDAAAKSAPPVAEAAPSASARDEASRSVAPSPVPPVSSAPATNRSVERGATLRLATTPARLDDVAGRIVRVTDGVGGFVRSSAVDSRSGLGGGATFELQVPVRRLPVALARLSELASVRSRNESSLDVTEQVGQARDRVAGLKAERRALLRQIERATTLDETARLRARLRSVETRLDRAESVRAQLRHRTAYSAVYVEVVTERRRGAAAGPWTPRDALHDAGRVLEVAAGVALIALAVLLPLALLAALAWPLGRAVQRRRREGALDAPAGATG